MAIVSFSVIADASECNFTTNGSNISSVSDMIIKSWDNGKIDKNDQKQHYSVVVEMALKACANSNVKCESIDPEKIITLGKYETNNYIYDFQPLKDDMSSCAGTIKLKESSTSTPTDEKTSQEDKTINIGFDDSLYPFSYSGSDSSEGEFVDLIRKMYGEKVNIRAYQFSTAIDAISKGHLDAILPISEKKAKELKLHISAFSSDVNGHAYTTKKIKSDVVDYLNSEDLDASKICRKGGYHNQYIKDQERRNIVDQANKSRTLAQCFQLLLEGTIDVVVENSFTGDICQQGFKPSNNSEECDSSGSRVCKSSDPVYNVTVHVGFADKDIRNKFNTDFQNLDDIIREELRENSRSSINWGCK